MERNIHNRGEIPHQSEEGSQMRYVNTVYINLKPVETVPSRQTVVRIQDTIPSPSSLEDDGSNTQEDVQGQHSLNRSSFRVPHRTPRSNHLFSCCLIVVIKPTANDNVYQPKVIYSFRSQNLGDLTAVSRFCFPDVSKWCPVNHYTAESHSFVLTDCDGNRKYGYCYRYLPPGSGNRLPEAFCIISSLQSLNFFDNLFEALYKARFQSLDRVQELFQTAYREELPLPGERVFITTNGPRGDLLEILKFVSLRRPLDERHEKVDYNELLKALRVKTIMDVMGSIFLEQRVIFMAKNLEKLTKCIHAMVDLLYPFSWPHIFISILPESMLDILGAPTPFLIGLLTHPHRILHELGDVVIVDIDTDYAIKCQGDKSPIIPRRLQKYVVTALKVKKTRNPQLLKTVLSEAFLRMFNKMIGHYRKYISTQLNGRQIFDREMFVQSVKSRSIRNFLDRFSKTQLFHMFIQEKIGNPQDSEC